jgi:hypothetical protein
MSGGGGKGKTLLSAVPYHGERVQIIRGGKETSR